MRAERRPFAAYGVLAYVALAANVWGYVRTAPPGDAVGLAFAAAVCLTYTAMYLAPVLLVAGALFALRRRWLGMLVAVGGAAIEQIWIFADRFLFRLYGFHLNGFVWNLVTTRGGIESMGGGADTEASVAMIAAGFVLLQAALWWLAGRPRVTRALAPLFAPRALVALVSLFL